MYSLPSLPPVVACKPIAEYHKEGIDVDIVKIENISVTSGIPLIVHCSLSPSYPLLWQPLIYSSLLYFLF